MSSKQVAGSCVDTNLLLCAQQLKPHHCYSTYNRALCCRTCQEIKEEAADPGASEDVVSCIVYMYM